MNKTEFVTALRDYATKEDARLASIMPKLARTLADHVDSMTIPYGDADWWRIEDRILGIIGHSMHVLREVDPSAYLESSVSDILRDATGSKLIAERADKFMRPEWHLINAKFMQFAEEVYDRGGLYQKIYTGHGRTMSHTFGETHLRSFVLAGRIMLTFARKTIDGEVRVTFICDDGDPHGITGGLTNQEADMLTIVMMIDEVRTNWAEQADNYRESESVFLA